MFNQPYAQLGTAVDKFFIYFEVDIKFYTAVQGRPCSRHLACTADSVSKFLFMLSFFPGCCLHFVDTGRLGVYLAS